MSIVAHAERELALLQRAADEDEDGPDLFQAEINRHLLALGVAFSEDDPGHSGSSASYAIGMLSRLLSFEPLTPITGAEDEWMLIDEARAGRPEVYQNVRCSHVFRDGDVAYDIDAVAFRERGGAVYTGGSDSARRISFPYTPHRREIASWRRRPDVWIARLRHRMP